MGTIHLGGLEEHRAPIQDMNVEGYLEQKRTETIIKIIEDGRNDVSSCLSYIISLYTNIFPIDRQEYGKRFQKGSR